MQRKLYRSERDRMIGGVCGGIAAYLDVDPVWIRLAMVVLTIVPHGVGLLAYIVLWIVMPTESRVGGQLATRETVIEGVAEVRDRAREVGEGLRQGVQGERPSASAPDRGRRSQRGAIIVGGLLIVIGVVMVLDNFRLMSFVSLRLLWPLILVVIGAALLLRR